MGADESARGQLRQLGVDPDRPTDWRRNTSSHLTPDEQTDELEKLRDLRDKGALSDEEYAREHATGSGRY